MDLFNDARGRPHFFRYLQIMEMEDHASTGGGVAITAFEPSSYMDVKFVVTKRVSLYIVAAFRGMSSRVRQQQRLCSPPFQSSR